MNIFKFSGFLILYVLILACSKDFNSQNVFPGETWLESTPEKQGMDSQKLNAAMEYLSKHCGSAKVSETVIIRNGYLVWKGSNIDTVHGSWSVGKVFASTVLGLLIDEEKCRIDDKAALYESRLAQLYPNVTLKHLANFTSGYDAEGGAKWGNDLDGTLEPWIPAEPLYKPGEAFLYWDDAARMFGIVLTKIANESMFEYINRKVCREISIPGDGWSWDVLTELDSLTINHGAGFVNISASALARFGHLFLNKGKWNGKQLISEEWVKKATSVQVPLTVPAYKDINPNPKKFTDHMNIRGSGVYGYHWFVNGIRADGKRFLPDAPEGTYLRSGYPHNKLIVIPEWNMVIVRLGDRKDGRAKISTNVLWNNTIKMISECFQ